MKKPSIVAAVLVLSMMLSVPALCQEEPPAPEKIDFAGILIDPETQLPAVGVKLSFVEPGEYFAVSGSGGRFVFKGIPKGTYAYLFAYERGTAEPARTILVAKGVKVALAEGDLPRVAHTPLLARPRDTKPPMATLLFKDRRDRENFRTIVMGDTLGHAWPEEYLTYTVGFPAYSCRRSSLRVADGSNGNEVPFQLSQVKYAKGDNIASCSITFPAVIEPFQKKVYVICSDWAEGFEEPVFETDLKVEVDEKTGEQTASNSLIAVRLPPAASTKPMPAAECPAPILAVRGVDGVWFGKGTLVSDRTVKSFTCEETEKGPLFKEFKISYLFAPKEGTDESKTTNDEYRLIIRLLARRDYVMVTEFMGGDVDASFRFSLSENLNPDISLLARDGAARFEPVPQEPEGGEDTLAVLRAVNPPGIRRSHNWYGLTTSGDRKDAIGIVQVKGASWQFAGSSMWHDGAWIVQAEDKDEVRVMAAKGPDVYFDFPHRPGIRQFAIAVFDKTRNWNAETLRAAEPDKTLTHYLNRLHIQLSQLGITTMTEAKMNLARSHGRPHLLFNTQTFPALKEKFKKDPNAFPLVLHDVFTDSRINTSLIRSQILAGTFAMQQAFVGLWNERKLSGFSGAGADPRSLEALIKYTALLYDAHAGSGLFSAREDEVIRGSFALVAAQFENPAWLPSLAHDAEAVASRDSTTAIISLLLDKHPKSATRILDIRKRLQNALLKTAAAGGMQHNPALALRALNIWAEMAPVFDNAVGILQVRSSPIEMPEFTRALSSLWYLTTPPDKRHRGLRLFPTLGRSQVEDTESLAVAGVAAPRLSARSPGLAGGLAWVWAQADKPLFRPAGLHRRLLRILDTEDAKIEPAVPDDVASFVLPNFGALMRTRFAKRDEAYLLFKCSADPNSPHQDQGSLLFHAFGTPLLTDPPAPLGRRGAWAHNTVRIGGRSHRSPGGLIEFVEQDQDNFAVGVIQVDALSQFKEYTPWELAAAAKAAEAAKKPFVLPPGHAADGSQSDVMLPMAHKLDTPVTVKRHVLFNKAHQYVVVYDRIQGYESSDVFYNVLADDARVENNVITFAGPFGVDMRIHAFGPKEMKIGLHKGTRRQWTLHLSQPAPPKPAEPEKKEGEDAEEAADDEEPERPVSEYFTVLCPSRRRIPGDSKDVKERAAPKIERLENHRAVRISYGKTVRYIFLANEPIEYKHGDLVFKGTRGTVTIQPTHFDVALFAAGEVRYQGRGVKTDHGRVRFTIAPGGFVSGQMSGPEEKRLTFYNLGWPLRRIAYRVDGMEYLGDGDEEEAMFGTTAGPHTILIEPK